MAKLSDTDFYVYRHVRLDTLTPFYIGEGRVSARRAYDKRNRNVHWNNIVNKAGYRVDILMSGLTKDESLDTELWFKEFYQRLGYELANYRIGREDQNYLYSPEAVERRASQLRGRKLSPEHAAKITTKFKKGHIPWNKGKARPDIYGKKYGQKHGEVYCVELQTTYSSPREASLILGVSYGNIIRVCTGQRKTAGKFTFKFKKDIL